MKILIIPLLVLSINCYSQEPAEGIFPVRDGEIYYEKIITVDSTNKETLYKAIKSWGVSAFKSQKDVLQADDRETGFVAYKYWFNEIYNIPPELKISGSSQFRYDATMKVFVKDDRVKIIVQGLSVKPPELDIKYNILTYRKEVESQIEEMKKKNKMYTRIMAKYSTEEYKKASYGEIKRNFEKANRSILSTINSLQLYINSGKNEFDF